MTQDKWKSVIKRKRMLNSLKGFGLESWNAVDAPEAEPLSSLSSAVVLNIHSWSFQM